MSATMAMEPTSSASSTRWWMTLLQAIAASLGLALVVAILLEIQEARQAGVTQLELEGPFTRIQPAQLRDVMQPWLTSGVPQMDDIKARLEQLPWVAQARVERAWPGVLRVRIWEYAPYAQWNDELLSTDGNVFRVPQADIPADLPRLSGPSGRQLEVRDAYQLLVSGLSSSGFVPIGLSLNDRGDWIARLASGAELRFGRADMAEQIEFIRGPVSKALTEKLSEVQYVDLHYSNGFAVAFKPAPKAAGDKR
jgi:cell division protein FtsQ